MNDTNLRDEVSINMPNGFEMTCKSYGIPKPAITWYKVSYIYNIHLLHTLTKRFKLKDQ